MNRLAASLPPHWPDTVRDLLNRHARLEELVPGQNPNQEWDSRSIRAIHPALPGWTHSSSQRLGVLHGLLFYALDALEEAHALFQEIDSFLGSYGHGMMHRREGDFANANYWFRHAGKPPSDVFAPGFNPVDLTVACQKAARAPIAEKERAVEALHREWIAVFDALLAGKIR